MTLQKGGPGRGAPGRPARAPGAPRRAAEISAPGAGPGPGPGPGPGVPGDPLDTHLMGLSAIPDTTGLRPVQDMVVYPLGKSLGDAMH